MNIVLLIIFVLLSAFFSGMEIAYLTANKLQVEVEKNRSVLSSTLASHLYSSPERYVSTMLIGNNIALVVYGIIFNDCLSSLLSPYIGNSELLSLAIQTVISTLIIIIFAEFLPKKIFRENSASAIRRLVLPSLLFYYILYPISSFVIWISDQLISLVFGKNAKREDGDMIFGRVDLDEYISTVDDSDGSEQIVEDNGVKLFRNALDFSHEKIRGCLVPRTEVVAIEVDETLDRLLNLFTETGFSKIIVYKDSIDNVIGYVHSYDMFKKPKSVKEIVREISFVPETMEANALLQQFLTQKRSLAVVVDEFGGTAGVVTSEDLMEEIFGEINDEHDRDTLEEVETEPGFYRFSARLEIDYLNEKYQLGIPESEHYETLAGYILMIYGGIPKVNTTVVKDDLSFRVIKTTQTRIELITLKKNSIFAVS